MFDQLFGKLAAVVQHKAAPYAVERARFLEHCAQQGYSRTYLKKVAATLLVAAYDLHSHRGLRAGPDDLEAAADRVQQLRSDLHRTGDAQTYRTLFVRVTTQWLFFTGALCVPAARPRHFSGLVEDFAQWMTQERGLSPHTIENRRWHVERFLVWLDGIPFRRRDSGTVCWMARIGEADGSPSRRHDDGDGAVRYADGSAIPHFAQDLESAHHERRQDGHCGPCTKHRGLRSAALRRRCGAPSRCPGSRR